MKTIAEPHYGDAARASWHGIKHALKVTTRQTKFFLCLMISLSMVFGYVLGTPAVAASALGAAWLGTLLLTLGAASFNNLQDRELDRHFTRTASRPLVTGELSYRGAGALSVALCVSGLCVLGAINGGMGNVFLGAAALICYNGIYTPLKRRSTLALIPGAICGAMPVLIGFHAGAGTLSAALAWLGFITLVLWQFPHFFLLLLRFDDDYRQHAKGLLRSHLDFFGKDQLLHIITAWSGALASTMWLYVAAGIIHRPFIGALALLSGLLLFALVCRHMWRKAPRTGQTRMFIAFNQLFAFFMALVVIDRILG